MKKCAKLHAGAIALAISAISFLTPPAQAASVIDPQNQVELKFQEFGIILDVNNNGVLDEEDKETGQLACITNMLQYLSAATSYDYKQYLTPAGSGRDSDTSGWGNTSDGMYVGGGNTTWIEPEADALQFWMAFSRQDHDENAPDGMHYEGSYALTPKGFNLNMIMNRTDRLNADGTIKGQEGDGFYMANPYGHTIYKPTEGVEKNTVEIDFAVVGSTLDERVILSDDVELGTPPTAPNPGNPPRPTAGTPILPGQEFFVASQGDLSKQTGLDSYDSYFQGDWTYNEDTTDGGVMGNLQPGETPGSMIIRVDLTSLGEGEDAIQKIIFYTFVHDDENDPENLNPYQMTFQKIELTLSAGDTFFIVDKCCETVPEPVTLALMGFGGLGLAGAGAWRRYRKPKVA